MSGMKWNFISLMFCVDFLLESFFRVLLSKTGRIKLDAVWVAVNCISVMTSQAVCDGGTR